MRKSPIARLRFTAYAWAKLEYLRDLGPTEVGGFGIANAGDPLLITDICLIKQTCSGASVEFDDADVADFFDECIDQGLTHEQFARVWIHTHPNGVHGPSMTDEETFEKAFGRCNWAVMYILSRDGQDYCALQYNTTPACRIELRNTKVDFSVPFVASNCEQWKKEYDAYVSKYVPKITKAQKKELKKYYKNSKTSFQNYYKNPIYDERYDSVEDILEETVDVSLDEIEDYERFSFYESQPRHSSEEEQAYQRWWLEQTTKPLKKNIYNSGKKK